jgi:hypothetical protein
MGVEGRSYLQIGARFLTNALRRLMDREALYWVLSTLPQVSAAFVAFIGFLTLLGLDEPLKLKADRVAYLRSFVKENFHSLNFERLAKMGLPRVSVMTDEELMDALADFFTSAHALWPYYDSIIKMNAYIARVRKFLVGFATSHLVVILTSLLLLPFADTLKNYRGMTCLIVLLTLVTVATSGYMVYEVLIRRQEWRRSTIQD